MPAGLAALVAEEAALAGRSGIETDFVANMVYRGKGGSYNGARRGPASAAS